MKKLLFILGLFLSLSGISQTKLPAGTIAIVQTSTLQRVHSSDSVQVYATMTADTTIQTITWQQVGGPTVSFTPGTTAYYGNATATSAFWLQGLVPGVYSFKATGTSWSKATANSTVVITIIPDNSCPVCPSPRIASSITITLASGQVLTIPVVAGTVGINYKDGSTQ